MPWGDLVGDKEVISMTAQLLTEALRDENTLKAATELVVKLCKDPAVAAAATELVASMGSVNSVQTSTNNLLMGASHAVMNDPGVMEHSKEFVADVVADDAIQRTGGDALWNTITYSVRPGIASLLAGVGVAFLGIGVFALGRGGYMEEVRRGGGGGEGNLRRRGFSYTTHTRDMSKPS